MAYATTTLTPAEQSKVPAGPYMPLLWDELQLALSLPSEERPRIYGHIEPLEGERWGQIIKLASLQNVEQYADRLSFAWMSGTTIADLISKA